MKRYLEFINEQVNCNQRLIQSAIHDNLGGVKQALYNGADIHYGNDYALKVASLNGHLEIVKYLIGQDADIHAENDQALRWASEEDHLYVVKYLCEYIIQKEPWHIPEIMEYIPDEIKEKYAHLFAASDMDLL